MKWLACPCMGPTPAFMKNNQLVIYITEVSSVESSLHAECSSFTSMNSRLPGG